MKNLGRFDYSKMSSGHAKFTVVINVIFQKKIKFKCHKGCDHCPFFVLSLATSL